MSLYDWLIQNIFYSVDIVQYGDYIVLTLCVLTILFCSLIAKALCGVFNLFIR
jgi:hypothetical protein